MGVHVIVARDPLIAGEAVTAHLPAGVESQRWYASELDPDRMFNQLSSPGLFEDELAWHYADFLDLKLDKAAQARLSETLARLPASISLVCSHVFDGETRADEDRRLKSPECQLFATAGELIDLRQLSEGPAAAGWLNRRAREHHGLALTREQVSELLELSAGRLALADTELAKLAMYKTVDQPQPIPARVFAATVSQNPQARFYDLVDAILGDRSGVLATLRLWHGNESDGGRLLAELRRRLLGLHELSSGGRLQPPYFERQLRQLAGRWPAARLGPAILLLAQTEHALRNSGILAASSKEAELVGLELLVVGLQAPRRALAAS